MREAEQKICLNAYGDLYRAEKDEYSLLETAYLKAILPSLLSRSWDEGRSTLRAFIGQVETSRDTSVVCAHYRSLALHSALSFLADACKETTEAISYGLQAIAELEEMFVKRQPTASLIWNTSLALRLPCVPLPGEDTAWESEFGYPLKSTPIGSTNHGTLQLLERCGWNMGALAESVSRACHIESEESVSTLFRRMLYLDAICAGLLVSISEEDVQPLAVFFGCIIAESQFFEPFVDSLEDSSGNFQGCVATHRPNEGKLFSIHDLRDVTSQFHHGVTQFFEGTETGRLAVVRQGLCEVYSSASRIRDVIRDPDLVPLLK